MEERKEGRERKYTALAEPSEDSLCAMLSSDMCNHSLYYLALIHVYMLHIQ